MSRRSNPAIGIDIGTTYSRVAVMRSNHVEIIPDEQGEHLTPSCVAFNSNTRLIGESAKTQATINPRNTIFDTKRLLGRSFDDQFVQKSVKLWPFTLVSKNNLPVIEVEHMGQWKTFTIVEIISMLLSKMRSIAEAFLGETITSAVVTVSCSFNHSQCQLMRDAGAIIGLNVLRIINEPTAAASLYTFQQQHLLNQEGQNILIFDLGGGNCNASLVVIDDGVVEVKATAGDSHLGGQDFDNCLIQHFTHKFKVQHKKDLSTNVRALCRLRIACERAKRALSISTSTTIEIDSLFEGIDFHSSITRADFEKLCDDQFRRCLVLIERLFNEQISCKMYPSIPKNAIDEVVLIGGSSRIPKIQQMITQFFDDKQLCKSINANEAVVCGAAVQAAILTGLGSDATKNILLIDVTSCSFGIEVEGVKIEIIGQNSTVPCKKSQTFSTVVDNQSSFSFNIYEGDICLGNFELNNIPPGLRGSQTIQVTFDLDGNGTCCVSAESMMAIVEKKGKNVSMDNSITNKKTINLNLDFCQSTKEQITLMSDTATILRDQDQQHADPMISKHQLEQCVYGSMDLVQEYLTWIENNEDASTMEVEAKHKQFHESFQTTCVFSKV